MVDGKGFGKKGNGKHGGKGKDGSKGKNNPSRTQWRHWNPAKGASVGISGTTWMGWFPKQGLLETAMQSSAWPGWCQEQGQLYVATGLTAWMTAPGAMLSGNLGVLSWKRIVVKDAQPKSHEEFVTPNRFAALDSEFDE